MESDNEFFAMFEGGFAGSEEELPPPRQRDGQGLARLVDDLHGCRRGGGSVAPRGGSENRKSDDTRPPPSARFDIWDTSLGQDDVDALRLALPKCRVRGSGVPGDN